ncbi:MAG: glycosyltransferase family 4 protein [Patescibacteria group bacterium]|jgi:glycosyltransferase involved in cell wall biosynthesis
MKLIIAAEIFPPDIGGPATYSKKLAEELSRRGWKISLICYSTKLENDNYPFSVVRILRGQEMFKRYVQYFWHLLKLANKDCDLIYAQGPVSSGLPAIVVRFLLSKKVVVKVVGDYAWEQARNSNQTEIGIDEFQKQNLSGKVGWLKKIEKFVCKNASKVIVPSEYLKKIVLGWGIGEDKIEVIYNSVGLSFSDWSIDSPKNDKEKWLVTAARLVPWKGIDTIIKLMPDLLKELPSLKFKIIGDGPQKEYLKHLIDELKLHDHVEMVGSLPREAVMGYLRLADLFILNSSYEGLSHVLIEALGCKTPILASNVGGNPELITDGQNGLLIEYNNQKQLKEAILKFYNDPELRQKFAENSKTVLKKFTAEEMFDKTTKALESVLKN